MKEKIKTEKIQCDTFKGVPEKGKKMGNSKFQKKLWLRIFHKKMSIHIFNQPNKFQAGKKNPQLETFQRSYRKLKTYV